MKYKSLMICGLGQAGKDKFAEALEKLGMPFESSSWVALDLHIWQHWGRYLYATKQECYADRMNHRMKWKQMITDMNAEDPTTLGRLIYARCPVYVGCRSIREFMALKNAGHFDLSVWVSAEERKPDLVDESCEIIKGMCDKEMTNDNTLCDLFLKAESFIDQFLITA